MEIDRFLSLFTDHWPDLLVLIALLSVFAASSVFYFRMGYRKGSRETAAKWRWDVEHMEKVIGQNVRENLESQIVYWKAKTEVYRDRLNEYVPGFRAIGQIVGSMAEKAGEE
jgi:hypothetical protein